MTRDRSRISRWATGLACFLTLLVLGAGAFQAAAQDPRSVERRGSGLGVRQQRVERMMEELERKFKTLAQAIKETEPERAERLIKAYDQARSLLLHERMGEISKLLDQSQLDSALGNQADVLVDLRKILSLLLDEQNDREKAMDEYERLEKTKADIENVLREEREQKRDADKLSDRDKATRDLQAQIKAVEELVRKQRELNEATQAARGAAASKLVPVARKQGDVKDETKKVANEVAGEEVDEEEQSPEAESSDAENPDREPAEGEPAPGSKSKGGDSKGENSKGSDAKGGESSEGEPSATEPSVTEPSEEEKEAAAEQAEKKAQKAAQRERTRPQTPAEQALRAAAKSQKAAEDKLNRGKPRSAAEDQQKALEDLEKALADLKQEQDRIASLPPEELKKMADKQSDTAAKTAQLHDDMKKGSKPSDDKSPPSEGKPSPGSESVGKAQKNMQDAAEDLGDEDPASASRKQSKAIKDLEKALEEIEERLAQLREETQLEKLARLEARFKEMLARQREATRATTEVETRRGADGELSRADALPVGKIAAEERALAEAAQQAYDIVFEDGTSVVFPEIIAHLRDDLSNVATLLEAVKTDAYVQSQQREIETTLEELIEALKKAKSDKEGGGGGGGGGGPQPLLPKSAELKLLKASQMRVNRRTESFDKSRPADGLDDVLKGEVENISERQQEVSDMTLRIIERQEEGP